MREPNGQDFQALASLSLVKALHDRANDVIHLRPISERASLISNADIYVPTRIVDGVLCLGKIPTIEEPEDDLETYVVAFTSKSLYDDTIANGEDFEARVFKLHELLQTLIQMKRKLGLSFRTPILDSIYFANSDLKEFADDLEIVFDDDFVVVEYDEMPSKQLGDENDSTAVSLLADAIFKYSSETVFIDSSPESANALMRQAKVVVPVFCFLDEDENEIGFEFTEFKVHQEGYLLPGVLPVFSSMNSFYLDALFPDEVQPRTFTFEEYITMLHDLDDKRTLAFCSPLTPEPIGLGYDDRVALLRHLGIELDTPGSWPEISIN